MPKVPPERSLFASYKLWRKHADPDGLISASEFEEMDEDDKREALRELGGPVAESGYEEDEDESDDADTDEDSGDDAEEPDEDDDVAPPPPVAEDDDDPLSGDVVELTDDIIDERTKDVD